jgi:hypothetical protein
MSASKRPGNICSSSHAQVAPQLLAEPGIGVLLAAKFIGETAGIDPLQLRRPTRPPRRLRADPRLPRTNQPPPPRPRRQPPVQQRLLHACDHPHQPRPCTAVYLARQRAYGKTKREAIRSLKRYLVRRVHILMRTPNSVPTTVCLTQEGHDDQPPRPAITVPAGLLLSV